jgi:hypothetical protein
MQVTNCPRLFITLALAGIILGACGRKSAGSKVRFGDVSECLASDDAFYSIVGGSDYSRLPLLRPWHIIELNKELNLANETTVVLSGLVEVGAKGGVFFGTAVGRNDEGRTTFWALTPTETPGFPHFRKFASWNDWIAHLGFAPSAESLQLVKTAVTSFGRGTDPFVVERK